MLLNLCCARVVYVCRNQDCVDSSRFEKMKHLRDCERHRNCESGLGKLPSKMGPCLPAKKTREAAGELKGLGCTNDRRWELVHLQRFGATL